MPWKKITPGEGRGALSGREARTAFAVRRNRTSGGSAMLVIPADQVNGATRCDIYRDGTKLAYALGKRGGYKLTVPGAGAARCAAIPATIGKSLPYGTHDVHVTYDGDMIVVDLAQITPIAVAAE